MKKLIIAASLIMMSGCGADTPAPEANALASGAGVSAPHPDIIIRLAAMISFFISMPFLYSDL